MLARLSGRCRRDPVGRSRASPRSRPTPSGSGELPSEWTSASAAQRFRPRSTIVRRSRPSRRCAARRAATRRRPSPVALVTVASLEPHLIGVLEKASGVEALRFETRAGRRRSRGAVADRPAGPHRRLAGLADAQYPMLDAVTRLSPLLALMASAFSALPRSRSARSAARPRDLTASEAEALRIANEDPLTGLPNRRKVLRDARPRAGRAAATDSVVCFAFLDLDGFKDVNEALGHQAGDELLVVGRRAPASAIAGRGHDRPARRRRVRDRDAGRRRAPPGRRSPTRAIKAHDAAVLDRRPGAAGRADASGWRTRRATARAATN